MRPARHPRQALALACAALVGGAAGSAFAQTPPAGASGAGKTKKVIRLEALTVEGRIQKPQAFYILQRSTLSFDELNRAESFIPKVEASVDREGF